MKNDDGTYTAATVWEGKSCAATRKSARRAVQAVIRLAYPSPVRGAIVSH